MKNKSGFSLVFLGCYNLALTRITDRVVLHLLYNLFDFRSSGVLFELAILKYMRHTCRRYMWPPARDKKRLMVERLEMLSNLHSPSGLVGNCLCEMTVSVLLPSSVTLSATTPCGGHMGPDETLRQHEDVYKRQGGATDKRKGKSR